MIINRLLPLSAIIFKIIYAQIFLNMTHQTRFNIGLIKTIIAIILIYSGIKFVVIWLVYLGAFVLGIGSAMTFLPVMGYIKYYPPVFVSLYTAGLAFAGFFLSSCYLIALKTNFKFTDVFSIVFIFDCRIFFFVFIIL